MTESTGEPMSEAVTRSRWADAFARQARSDWQVYQQLSQSDLPRCHALHYLQMTCEKIAKAYRIRDSYADVDEIMKHHIGFVSFINIFARSEALREQFTGRDEQLRQLVRYWSHIARQIERLAPAVDRDQRPDNCEYPWFDGQDVIVPCLYDFPNLDSLSSRDMRGHQFMKMLARAIDHYETIFLHAA